MTNHAKSIISRSAALLGVSLAAGCGTAPSLFGGGGGGSGQTTPRVVSNSPADGETNVPINGPFSATFSEAMDPATLNGASFTVTAGSGNVPVEGTVIYADSVVVFWPAEHLATYGSFTARVSTQAESVPGVALEEEKEWTFQTGESFAPGQRVDLRTAGDFAVLAKSGISTVPSSAVTGNLGVSPAAATYITGFSLTADSTNVFSSSPQVTGKVYAADYHSPTPANMTSAVSDMELAFTDAAGRPPDVTELGAGNIGGLVLDAGVYKWGTGLLIPTDVTLNGSATDVWIFQIAQDLTMASSTSIVMAGGAQAKNVFWQVSGMVELGTTAHLEGVVLCQTSITLRTGASVEGRLLAQTAVDIDASTVTEPAE